MTPRPLILIGDGLFAEIAFEYFNHDSEYQVTAFAVERNFLKRDRLFDRPVVPFEEMERLYPLRRLCLFRRSGLHTTESPTRPALPGCEGHGISAGFVCQFARFRLAKCHSRRALFYF